MPIPVTALMRAMRPHHWAKNTLLFLPVMAAHLTPDAMILARLVLAFVSFSLVASGVYLINDLRDSSTDRTHPVKRLRPVASGEVSLGGAGITSLLLTLAGVGLAAWLDQAFALVVALYFVIAVTYSLVLRSYAIVDVITLAGLYATRIVAGAAVANVSLSRWFLAFSLFLFGSLALVKRVAEILTMESTGHVTGRGYETRDLPVLTAMGAALAGVSALVYSLYITGEDVKVLYGQSDLLWFGLPLFLYWISRIWLLTGRGTLRDDPVTFALTDRVSYAVLALFMLTVWLAT